MLVNPIRGKAGKQIVAVSPASGTILYTVPAGKYFELASAPANINFTANGVTSSNMATATLVALPLLLQAGTVVTSATSSAVFIGTEYDA
jgi:hypothetical protein